jgi:hypothetical protein
MKLVMTMETFSRKHSEEKHVVSKTLDLDE